jgi:hypothetical protein
MDLLVIPDGRSDNSIAACLYPVVREARWCSGSLRVLVDLALRKLRQSFVGLLFLGKRLFQ